MFTVAVINDDYTFKVCSKSCVDVRNDEKIHRNTTENAQNNVKNLKCGILQTLFSVTTNIVLSRRYYHRDVPEKLDSYRNVNLIILYCFLFK